MLEIIDLETGYGKKQVLFGVSLEVREDEIVALVGPNGAGKSTVLKTVCSLIPIWGGEIRFKETSIRRSTPAQNVARGITYAPQGNRVFDELTVMQNLEVGGFCLESREINWRIDELFGIFPALKERAFQEAGRLSGGEQQMLALARALVPKPDLLMLDEPSLGLSPRVVNLIFEKISQINHDTKTSILIVEQKVRQVLEICHRVYALRLGKIAFKGIPEDLQEDKGKFRQLFL